MKRKQRDITVNIYTYKQGGFCHPAELAQSGGGVQGMGRLISWLLVRTNVALE